MTSQVLTEQLNVTGTASRWQTMLHAALSSNAGYGALSARIGLAVVMFPHGAQKVLGLFGGYGWNATYNFFTDQMSLPGIVAVTVMLLEFIGPLLLLAGFAVRPVALAFVGLMIGTIVTVHAQFGFFMNWSGQQAGEGIEYALLAIALAASLVFNGGGAWSVDKTLANRLAHKS